MGALKVFLLIVAFVSIAQGQMRDEVGVQVPSLPNFPSEPGNTEDQSTAAPPVLNPLALLPLPNGPFYGFPFDARQTVGRFLPLTVAGTCEERAVYNISRVEDLLSYKTDLECIFNIGTAPNKVPTGAYYARPLTAFNTQLFNTFSSLFWSGLYVNSTECNGMMKYIGWNNLAGRPLFPFEAKIEPLHLNLAPGEYNDGRKSLILDYSANLVRSCPDYRNNLQRSYQSAVVRRRTLNSDVFPANQFVSAIRFIGKQDDGSSIYIGKTFMKDPFRPDSQAVTIAFFSVVNYEENVMKDFSIGDILPPIRKTFKYMFPGIIDLPLRLLPIDNLITTPLRTVQKMVRGAFTFGRNSLLYANEIARGKPSFAANTRIFQDAFKNDRLVRGKPEPTVKISLRPPSTSRPQARGLFGRRFFFG